MGINGDQWAAHILHNEPDNAEASWIDCYAQCIGRCKPELTAEQAVEAARQSFAREGDWNNPKIAAGMDAVFGQLEP